MEVDKVLVAMSNNILNKKMLSLLEFNGFSVVFSTSSGKECLIKTYEIKPEAIIIDYDLPDMDGYCVTKKLLFNNDFVICLLVNQYQKKYIDIKLCKEANFLMIEKPVNKNVLVSNLQIMLKTQKKIACLKSEIDALKSTLMVRKNVEKAKGILMVRDNLTEHDAYHILQRRSMNTGIPLNEIANSVIKSSLN